MLVTVLPRTRAMTVVQLSSLLHSCTRVSDMDIEVRLDFVTQDLHMLILSKCG